MGHGELGGGNDFGLNRGQGKRRWLDLRRCYLGRLDLGDWLLVDGSGMLNRGFRLSNDSERSGDGGGNRDRVLCRGEAFGGDDGLLLDRLLMSWRRCLGCGPGLRQSWWSLFSQNWN